jgi:hypothetical protein
MEWRRRKPKCRGRNKEKEGRGVSSTRSLAVGPKRNRNIGAEEGVVCSITYY